MKNKVIPFFDRVHSVQFLSTPDGFDMGYMIIIAHDPNAGRKDRYNVFKMNCQTAYTSVIGRELPINHSKELRDKTVYELVRSGKGNLYLEDSY